MAIVIRETFQVKAPIDEVWRFMMTPSDVVTCLPGAELDEVVDDRTFLGTVKVKVGAVMAKYKGKVRFTEVDEGGYVVKMLAEGREASGGMAKGTVSGRLRSLDDAQTEVVAEASVDLTGRIMQVGRGMIQGVSQQLFLQFVSSTKERLEARRAAADAAREGASPPPEPTVPAQKPIRILPLMFRVFAARVAAFFRRLFGRGAG